MYVYIHTDIANVLNPYRNKNHNAIELYFTMENNYAGVLGHKTFQNPRLALKVENEGDRRILNRLVSNIQAGAGVMKTRVI